MDRDRRGMVVYRHAPDVSITEDWPGNLYLFIVILVPVLRRKCNALNATNTPSAPHCSSDAVAGRVNVLHPCLSNRQIRLPSFKHKTDWTTMSFGWESWDSMSRIIFSKFSFPHSDDSHTCTCRSETWVIFPRVFFATIRSLNGRESCGRRIQVSFRWVFHSRLINLGWCWHRADRFWGDREMFGNDLRCPDKHWTRGTLRGKITIGHEVGWWDLVRCSRCAALSWTGFSGQPLVTRIVLKVSGLYFVRYSTDFKDIYRLHSTSD